MSLDLYRRQMLQNYLGGKSRARAAEHENARDLLGYKHELGQEDRNLQRQVHEDSHGLDVDKFGFAKEQHADAFGLEQQKHTDAFGLARDRFGFDQQQHKDVYGLAREKFGHDQSMGTWDRQLSAAKDSLGSYRKEIDPETGEERHIYQPGINVNKDWRPVSDYSQYMTSGQPGGQPSNTYEMLFQRQDQESAAAPPPAAEPMIPVGAAPVPENRPRLPESNAFLNRFLRTKAKPFLKDSFHKPFTSPAQRY